MSIDRERQVGERWARAERLYHEALEREPQERVAFLDAACHGDEELRREVESLLRHAEAADRFMEEPAVEIAARQLAKPGQMHQQSINAGDRIGVYEVIAPIGAGGMGEVYEARDPRLGRTVAVKIIRDTGEAGPAASHRFAREGRALAALSHPHICPIFDVGRHGSLDYFVMEYLEGETLAARIARGPLPIDQALTCAIEMVDALEAAHRQGIVHRDLKPANVMLTRTGVKLLDFGLARPRASVTGGSSATDAAQGPVTRPGLVVGTIPYMAPERLEGREADARSDLFAAGAVLYEMLTGRRPFAGDSQARLIGAILEREPESVSSLRPEVSPEIARVVEICLAKDPDERWQSATDLERELRRLAGQPSSGAARLARAEPRRRSRRLVPLVALAALVAAVWAIWYAGGRRGASAVAVTRSTLTLPEGAELDARDRVSPLAISPDGRTVVYAADAQGRLQLYVRRLDAFESTALPGTDEARYPFFSPDGRWIGFFARGRLLRVPIDGGAPVPVCAVPSLGRGGTWGSDGTIVFPGETGLYRVDSAGGTAVRVKSRDSDIDGRVHSWPQYLPSARELISTVDPGSKARLAVLSFDTGAWRVLGPGDGARFVPPDLVIFHGGTALREGQLFAMRLHPESLSPAGAPVSVINGVFCGHGNSDAYFAVSQTGTLVFAPGGLARALVRVDRHGRRTPLVAERRGFRFPAISRDGRYVTAAVDPRPSEIWAYDLERQSRWRLGSGITPIWTPDGKRIAYQSGGSIVWQLAEGRGDPEPLLRNTSGSPQGWTPDGRTLVYVERDPETEWDIWVFRSGAAPRPLIRTKATEATAELSPDGRWLAFLSTESGRSEVYVVPFPNVNDGRWTISTAGGTSPRWSPDGRELFYIDNAALMAVPITVRHGRFTAGAPARLFDGPFDLTNVRNFDVMPDGQHFVMVEADPEARPDRLHVVQNWRQEVERLVARQ